MFIPLQSTCILIENESCTLRNENQQRMGEITFKNA